MHPQVPVGGDQATHWARWVNADLDYWWAEIATTYADGRHFTGKTSCWLSLN